MEEPNKLSAPGAGVYGDLKRNLSTFNLVTLGVGSIVGAGLFALVGIVAGGVAGPSVVISFGIAALACFFSALCYAEFASMVPRAGSAYSYTAQTMGKLLGFIIGWDLVLEYALGAATVAVSWSAYFVKFLGKFGIHLPAQYVLSPFEKVELVNGSYAHGVFNLPAAVLIFTITFLLIRGVSITSFVNTILVGIKFLVIFTLIFVGISFIDTSNYVPFIPPNTGVFGEFGVSGILRGAAVLFFAFLGFDALSTASQEVKNPQKAMPRAIFISLIICTLVYIAFSLVLTGMVNYKEFAGTGAPIVLAIEKTGLLWLQQGVDIAILVGFASVIIIQLLAQTRIFYAMSEDKLLPKMFSNIHAKYGTPAKSHLLFASAVSLLAGLVPVSDLGHMVSIGTLLSFVLVSVSIIILRKKKPDLERPFRVPGSPVIPIIGALVCILLMASLPLETWLRLIIWLAIGMVVFVFYSRKNMNK